MQLLVTRCHRTKGKKGSKSASQAPSQEGVRLAPFLLFLAEPQASGGAQGVLHWQACFFLHKTDGLAIELGRYPHCGAASGLEIEVLNRCCNVLPWLPSSV
jgi:hypothetical protein